MTTDPVTIRLDSGRSVSGLLQLPAQASACLVLAHGAGAGMTHGFMTAVAAGLAERGIATLRFQFPYMEQGSRRPDPPALAHAAVRAAVATAVELAPGLPMFAGGKSFGARMTSQAQAEAELQDVRGLVFLGFPLHPANKPSNDRARHLASVRNPMLFIQGTRDALADTALLVPMVSTLGDNAKLVLIRDADHSFHVPARSGRKDAEVLNDALDTIAVWIGDIATPPGAAKAAPLATTPAPDADGPSNVGLQSLSKLA